MQGDHKVNLLSIIELEQRPTGTSVIGSGRILTGYFARTKTDCKIYLEVLVSLWVGDSLNYIFKIRNAIKMYLYFNKVSPLSNFSKVCSSANNPINQ